MILLLMSVKAGKDTYQQENDHTFPNTLLKQIAHLCHGVLVWGAQQTLNTCFTTVSKIKVTSAFINTYARMYIVISADYNYNNPYRQ